MNHFRPSLLSIAAACACFAASSTAQNIVHVPSDTLGRSAITSESRYPIANGANRTLMLFENYDTLIPNGRSISRIGFRLDEARTAAGAQVLLEIYMSNTQVTSSGLDLNFGTNFTSARTLVKSMGSVSLPPITAANAGALVWINLDTPFVFDASQNLLVDFVVTANNQGSVAFTYPLDRARFYSPTTDSGGACNTSAGSLPALSSIAAPLGGNWTLRGTNMPGNAPTALLFGIDGIQAVGTPLQLFRPAAQVQCEIFVNPAAVSTVTVTTNSSGGINFSLPIPDDISLLRLPLTVQALHLDFFAQGKLVTSNAHEMVLGVNPAVSFIAASSGPAATRANVIRRNSGIVTVFDHN